MKPNRHHALTGIIALAATTTVVTAAPGSLDSSFNATGLATANYGATEAANAVAVMANGKIVVAGNTNTLGNSDIAVLRYNPNGTLDTTFSGDGGVITNIGPNPTSEDFANAVAVLPNGKILVAGYSNANGDNDFLLMRYNADGTLDNFFGQGGRALFNHSTDEQALAMAVQSDGKIVLAGVSHIGLGPDFAILRFNPDGSPDTTFSGDGFVEYSFNTDEFAQAVAIQNDGKIVVAGYTNSNVNDFAVLRLNTNGTLDTSFDTDGKVTYNFGNDDRATGVAIQKDGKVVVSGTWSGGAADFAILRYTPTGALDPTFSGDGRQNVAFVPVGFGLVDFCQSLALQADGKIVLGGYTNQFDANNDFGIVRLRTDGELDTTFDGDGKLTTALGTGTNDRIHAMTLQPNGKLVVAGLSGTDFALGRYNLLVRADARVGAKKNANIGNNIYNTTGASQTLALNVNRSGGVKNSYVRIQNDGHEVDSFKIRGRRGNAKFKVKYFKGSTDVTAAVTAGTYTTGNIAPGATFLLRVQITASTANPNQNRSFFVTGTSVTDPTSIDTVRVKATSK